MITFLQGTIAEKQPTRVVLDVAGVGYEVFIPLSSFDHLPVANATCRLLTYDHVREDQHTLYGFRTEAERRMFVLLLSVNGIGPKLALSALSGLSLRDLTMAITGNDFKRLSSISGVGRKKAERIVVELRDKISEGEALEAVAGAAAGLSEKDAKLRDAILAMVRLGYTQNEARAAVRRAIESDPALAGVEEIIRKALSDA